MAAATPHPMDSTLPGLALALQQTLPRLPRTLPETHFDSLRRAALQHAQALSGQRWTDYNLHDPGVTLLEAFCYALTELGYRAEAPVADQLADARHQIDWPAHGLLPPAEALPCRPGTGADLQRWLLDQVPGLAGVLLQPATEGSATPGVLDLLLEPAEDADETVLPALVRQVAAGCRNLGQDLGQVRVLRRRPCRLLGALRIEGGRDPAEIVADVHQRCAAWLAGGVHFDSHRQALAGAAALDEVLEGPPTQHAAAQTWRLATHRPDTVFIADLVRCARETPGVADVAWLALQPEGGVPAHASLRARDLDAGWTLALVLPAGDEGGSSAAPGDAGRNSGESSGNDRGENSGRSGIGLARPGAGLSLHRRGNAVELSWPAVRHFDAELRATRLAHRPVHGPAQGAAHHPSHDPAHHAARHPDTARPGAPPGLPPLPTGQAQPPLPHLPLQHHLPGAYAVGVHGLSTDAQPRERAQAQQLQGFVALLDQLLAHGSAQAAFARRLFHVPPVAATAPGSPRPAPGAAGTAPSYAWQVLGEAQVPGLGALLALPPALLQARHCAPFDDAAARRSRMLDLLLAMHGQAWPQHSLRQFMDHLTEPEREAELLALKQAFTREVGAHCRDRGAGWDWTRPAGADASGLQRRVMLLLGLGIDTWAAPPSAPAGSPPEAGPAARPLALTAGLRGRVLVESAASDADAGAAPGARSRTRPAPWFALDLGCSEARRAAGAEAAKLLQGVPLARQARLPGPLLRCATRHDRWGVVPQADGSLALMLGPDENGRWWELPAPAGGADAGRAGGAANTRADARADTRADTVSDTGAADAAADGTAGAAVAPGPAAWQAALARAAALRRFALALDGGCEGLHVVEHVLLRPLGGARVHPGVPAVFHHGQISAVLPAWTQRGRRPAFRHLAEETLAMNSPAHLQVHTLWLSAAEMGDFEALLHAWQAARRQHHAQPCSPPAQDAAAQLDALDRHAAVLARWLLDHGAAAAPGGDDEDHLLWQDEDEDRPADDADDPAANGRDAAAAPGPATPAAATG